MSKANRLGIRGRGLVRCFGVFAVSQRIDYSCHKRLFSRESAVALRRPGARDRLAARGERKTQERDSLAGRLTERSVPFWSRVGDGAICTSLRKLCGLVGDHGDCVGDV